MKAVQLSRFGGSEALDLVEIPTPVPEAGEILVRVHASGINFFETLMLQDRYAVTPDLPIVLGVEVSGVVEALGTGVSAPKVGARVAVPLFAIGRGGGGYAEYVVADAASLIPLPDTLPFEDAAALMVQGLTALHLVRVNPPMHKTVLITAAAGGVGSLLIQLAKRAGAGLVIAAASSSEKLDLARSLGADAGVDYSRPNWASAITDAAGGSGIDIVYDLVGGVHTKTCLEVLAPAGELVFGAMGRFSLERQEVGGMLSANQSLRGFALLPFLTPANLKADLEDLFRLAARGDLQVVRGGCYPLDQAAEAHHALQSRKTVGKLVLVP
jgi:NADPH2:quinone reductase